MNPAGFSGAVRIKNNTVNNHKEENAVQKNLLLSVLAGVVLFVWGFISWAVLPWHNMVANKFTSKAAVTQALK